MFDNLKADLRAARERDPAARNNLEVFLLYSGFHAICHHRVAHFYYRHRLFFLARLTSQLNKFFTGVEIHPAAKIGPGFFIDHGTGVVIGETTEIGANCTIYQGATLGGTGKDIGKRHPTLGNNVMVGAGAKVLGPFTVGDNSKIAANAVVLDTVPPDSTAVGVPARVARRNGVKPRCNDLDQIHIPDPIAQELCALRIQLERMQKELDTIKGENAKQDVE